MAPQYTPMAPTLVREPFHRDGWVYEEKVDGWRTLAYKAGNCVRLLSRDLDAFSTEHRCCGDLDAGVDGPIVWIACECGARMARLADERDALAADG